MRTIKLILLAMSLSLSGCGDRAGTVCAISGSGFHAKQNCQHKCLQYRQIACPSGEIISPKICSGKSNCQPGTCPADQACYHINDPYNEESYCMPSNVCGEMDAETRSNWEIESKAQAAETRRKRDEKFGRKPGQQPATALDAQELPEERQE